MKTVLIYFYNKYKGDWDKIFKALENKERVKLDDIKSLEKRIKKEAASGDEYITILDDNYPNDLKRVWKPPFVIRTTDKYEFVEHKKVGLLVRFIDAEFKNNKNHSFKEFKTK